MFSVLPDRSFSANVLNLSCFSSWTFRNPNTMSNQIFWSGMLLLWAHSFLLSTNLSKRSVLHGCCLRRFLNENMHFHCMHFMHFILGSELLLVSVKFCSTWGSSYSRRVLWHSKLNWSIPHSHSSCRIDVFWTSTRRPRPTSPNNLVCSEEKHLKAPKDGYVTFKCKLKQPGIGCCYDQGG